MWLHLLQAQRHFLLGAGDSAINGFQDVVLEDRSNVDGWLGLGEALFISGDMPATLLRTPYPPSNVWRPSTARLCPSLLSTWWTWHCLPVMKPRRSGTWISYARAPLGPPGRLQSCCGFRKSRLIQQHTGSYVRATGKHCPRLVAVWLRDAKDPIMADSLGVMLTGPGMTPDDNWRGADARLVALTAQGRWNEGLAAWRAVEGRGQLDSWMVQAYLAGYPAAEHMGANAPVGPRSGVAWPGP